MKKLIKLRAFAISRGSSPPFRGWENYIVTKSGRRYLIQIALLPLPTKIKRRWQLIIQKFTHNKKFNYPQSKTVLIKHYTSYGKCFDRATRFAVKKKLAKAIIPAEKEG